MYDLYLGEEAIGRNRSNDTKIPKGYGHEKRAYNVKTSFQG